MLGAFYQIIIVLIKIVRVISDSWYVGF